MKISSLCGLLLMAVLANGCVLFHDETKSANPSPSSTSSVSAAPATALNPIITPDNSLMGTVADYNATGRFVVLTFPVGQMPQMGHTLFLYRAGLKAGEVKITGPQRDNDIVADLVTGTAQVGDEVRDQ
jgi:hypothetical protein